MFNNGTASCVCQGSGAGGVGEVDGDGICGVERPLAVSACEVKRLIMRDMCASVALARRRLLYSCGRTIARQVTSSYVGMPMN